MMRYLNPFFGLIGCLLLIFSTNRSYAQRSPRCFKLPAQLEEVSGLYRQANDSLWWHNDSGSAPVLYLTNAHGELLDQRRLPVRAIDWEDITADNNGNIYIGDFGDNRRRRDELRVYRYSLADNRVDSIVFEYPHGKKYDVEAMAWQGDELHLFTKSRIAKGMLMTYHMVLPDQAGAYTAELRDSFALRKRVVTAAAYDEVTGDWTLLAYFYKRRLGFIPYSAANVFVFKNAPAGYPLRGQMLRKRISWLVATQYESVDFWDGRHILVASEKTLFIKAKAKRVRRKH